MSKLLMLIIGILLMVLPRISKTDDSKVDDVGAGDPQSAIEQLKNWSPPPVAYSLSTIGRTITHDGESLRCYTVQEGKQVLMPMFADYRALYRVAWLWMAARAEYQAIVTASESRARVQDGMILFYKDESENWYKVANAKNNRLELRERWSWLPWALLAAESLVVGIFGIANSSK